MPIKLSASQVHAVLSEVPSTLRALVEERDTLKEKLASTSAALEEYRSKERLNKLATKMEDKGFMPGSAMEDKIDFLSKKAASGQLEAIEQAVDMSVPSQPIGWLGGEVGNSSDELTAYCLGELVD